jgi:hypothetical protein
MHGRGEKIVQGFGGKAGGKETSWKTEAEIEYGIRMDVMETGWKDGEWVQLAQDRDQWQAVVNVVMNLRLLVPQI